MDGNGGSDGGKAGEGGGGQGGGGGSAGQGVVRDTSGYEGHLVWTTGSRMGLHVWDLANSEIAFSREGDGTNEMPGEPSASGDGRYLAYTLYEGYFLTSFFTTVHRLDLETGEEILYPTDDLESDQVRNTFEPSISKDGKRIAVVESTILMEGDMAVSATSPAIEVWNTETNERIRVVGEAYEGRHPVMDESAQTIFFISDKDTRNRDFYMVPVEADAPVTRLTVYDHPEISAIEIMYVPPALSADGRWLAFLARLEEGGRGGFVMDTTTGSVERIGTSSDLTGVSISSDGSLVGWNHFNINEETSTFLHEALVAPRGDYENAVLVSDNAMMSAIMAISADGSQVSFVDMDYNLVVSRPDGSDVRIVSGREEKNVSPGLGMSISLF